MTSRELLALRQAVRLHPANALKRLRYAADLGGAGLHAQSEREFRILIERNPRETGARCGLGHVLASEGRKGEAIAAEQRAIALGGRHGDFWAGVELQKLTAGH